MSELMILPIKNGPEEQYINFPQIFFFSLSSLKYPIMEKMYAFNFLMWRMVILMIVRKDKE